MNITYDDCVSDYKDVVNLTYGQLACLTIINLLVMAGNLIANPLVMYILFKTKQLSNASCKLILALTISDLLIALLAQSLFLAVIYGTNCYPEIAFHFFSAFLLHLCGYTIIVIGVDRYVRIRYYSNYKTILTTRFILILISVTSALALAQGIVNVYSLLANKEKLVKPIFFIIDGIAISFGSVLQLRTIRSSNAVRDLSSLDAFQKTNKIITKICLRIVLLGIFFFTPFVIMNPTRKVVRNQLEPLGKLYIDFISWLCLIWMYMNSFANALIFLTANLKARRYLRNVLS